MYWLEFITLSVIFISVQRQNSFLWWTLWPLQYMAKIKIKCIKID